jgi:hypothetical protein
MKLNNIIFHPILFGIFPVISLFESNINFTSFAEIILPLIIIIGIISIIWIFLKKILSNNKKAALIISLFVILFFAYGPTFFAIDDLTINGEDIGRHSYLLIPFLGIGIFGSILVIKSKKEFKNITKISNVISLVLVSVILISVITYNLENSVLIEIEQIEGKINEDIVLPDIYYIILDGYPGKTSLQKISNYDNQKFLESLSKQGFFIQDKSYANYAHTFLSIPSILNMKYLDDVVEKFDGRASQAIPYKMGSDNKVMNFIKSQGYITVSFDSGWGFTRDMESVDLKLCGDNKIFNSEFTIELVKNSMLNPIYVKIFETNNVEMKLCIFNELVKIKERTNEPIFVFAHIFLPHPPYQFEANGEIRQLNNLDPHLESIENLDKDAFVNQLKFTNKKIMEVTTKLLNSEKKPIIIIQSDHGSAFTFNGNLENWETPTDEMIKERMDSINFIFLPKNLDNIFSENTTPVNTFSILFNHYFKTDFKIYEDKMYFGRDGSYNLMNVTEILENLEN